MLGKREARLRETAVRSLGHAASRLAGGGLSDAVQSALYDHPGVALRRIAVAKQHLRKAERTLKAWAGRRRKALA